MGQLYTQPFSGFVQFLQRRFAIETFVETGTYRGDSTAFATAEFPQVVSIEIDPGCHQAAAARLKGTNARLVLGDSRTEMPRIVDALTGPAFFWLDGHAGGGFHGSRDDCPLLEELAAIAASPFQHFIFVDDARAFLAPPPPPFDADAWPELQEVIATATRRTTYSCAVLLDVLICVPPDARPYLRAFANRVRPRI